MLLISTPRLRVKLLRVLEEEEKEEEEEEEEFICVLMIL
jgi:hypothetical protein